MRRQRPIIGSVHHRSAERGRCEGNRNQHHAVLRSILREDHRSAFVFGNVAWESDRPVLLRSQQDVSLWARRPHPYRARLSDVRVERAGKPRIFEPRREDRGQVPIGFPGPGRRRSVGCCSLAGLTGGTLGRLGFSRHKEFSLWNERANQLTSISILKKDLPSNTL